MRSWRVFAAFTVLLASHSGVAHGQQFNTDDPVIRQIWLEGMDSSQIQRLGQVLLDSLGPRLTGTPAYDAAAAWVMGVYRSWGIEADKEDYGSWRAWRRGLSHLDLLEPRTRSLEGTLLAWSPGTDGPVQGEAIPLPEFSSPGDLRAFLPQVKGRFILTSNPEPTCRPDGNWEEYATPESFERMKKERATADEAWEASITATGLDEDELPRVLEDAGAVGVLTSEWPGNWGVARVFDASTRRVPTFSLSCEDYGLVFRLAQHNQGPVIRAHADAEFLGEVPAYNVIGRIAGTELPEEYVLLSAHFDSWDAGSGAVDNGTGTITMLEAMRILKKVYPNPRRTILVGHWNSEEQGLNGSRAFATDHPEVVEGLQAVLNQDTGTGRVVDISMQGLLEAGAYLGRWMASIPTDITRHIELEIPGRPGGGGSDYAAFICYGAPSFHLRSLDWAYDYTWHTGRDTFDKVVLDEVKNNAVLTAMLAYLASQEPEKMPRDRALMTGVDPRTGEPMAWPLCRDGARVFNR